MVRWVKKAEYWMDTASKIYSAGPAVEISTVALYHGSYASITVANGLLLAPTSICDVDVISRFILLSSCYGQSVQNSAFVSTLRAIHSSKISSIPGSRPHADGANDAYSRAQTLSAAQISSPPRSTAAAQAWLDRVPLAARPEQVIRDWHGRSCHDMTSVSMLADGHSGL